ncbi:HepT-like ribonuclease domain-containing protein [Sediminibacterium sp.]|uniref:HepT-like ribonuclease domain-containing protein n=1 Tax=Sediminibacterium sp. TaxID=1917865 RepID=UPI003F6E8263
MSKDPIEFLKHIYDECGYLISISSNLSKEKFISDETLKRAVVRSLEIIGEATKKIPSDFKENTSDIEWKSMAGMRDRLIHDYMGVNYSIVWDVLLSKIPVLHNQVKAVLNKD